jgi:hypothetical protein
MSDDDEDSDEGSELSITMKDLIGEAVLDSADNVKGYLRLQQLFLLGEYTYSEYFYEGPPLRENDECSHCGLLIAATHGLEQVCSFFLAIPY